jgi:hypothetical protein
MSYRIIFLVATVFVLRTFANAQECNVAEFKRTAEKLDYAKIESVLKLASEFEQYAKGQTQQCTETLFVEFRLLYYKALSEYEKAALKNLNNSYPMVPKMERRLRAELKQVGWELYEIEGYYYIGENGAWFLDRYRRILTKPWIQYFNQRKLEIRQKFSEDAALLISWEALRKRIAFWEEFLTQNPSFPLKDEINSYLDTYIRTFLTGMDNSQITVDYNNNALRKEVKTAYETYPKKDKSSRYHKIVGGYYEILKRSGFVVTEELADYLDAQGIKSMNAVQPPTY